MGMYDEYEPTGDFVCAACGGPVTDWQGKDGPNALLIWRQGVASPGQQDIAPESRTSPEELAEIRLPPTFGFYGTCEQDHWTEAVGRCHDDVWSETAILRSGLDFRAFMKGES